ncbi:MAG: DUF4388 domain-containing protein [Acidobacteria bacterium]|uniref:DUF4388 domain-containing protein n=1 Tax=Candidatus Polarisedimenticola svalbardensis TaxID=2886004 RepID=A0A8J6XXU6_9BACT|nr:DUF4388 domain-containing protein [Candidatus Polarisedimenticola svalbardensis]
MVTLSIVRRKRPQSRTTGNLEDLSFAELTQLMALGGKTGCIRITDGEFRGEAWFVDGRLRHARTNESSGEQAFMAMVGWTSGTFLIAHGMVAYRLKMDHDAMHLLMKSMKQMDEAAAGYFGQAEAI